MLGWGWLVWIFFGGGNAEATCFCVFFWGVVGIFHYFLGVVSIASTHKLMFFTNENKKLFAETQLVITVLCPV